MPTNAKRHAIACRFGSEAVPPRSRSRSGQSGALSPAPNRSTRSTIGRRCQVPVTIPYPPHPHSALRRLGLGGYPVVLGRLLRLAAGPANQALSLVPVMGLVTHPNGPRALHRVLAGSCRSAESASRQLPDLAGCGRWRIVPPVTPSSWSASCKARPCCRHSSAAQQQRSSF